MTILNQNHERPQIIPVTGNAITPKVASILSRAGVDISSADTRQKARASSGHSMARFMSDCVEAYNMNKQLSTQVTFDIGSKWVK
jgi:hypothetical protein